MSNPDRDLRVTVRSDPKLLTSIRSLVRGWVESWDIDDKTANDVVLAVDEACTNAIRHAYHKGDPMFEKIDAALDALVDTIIVEPRRLCRRYGMCSCGSWDW